MASDTPRWLTKTIDVIEWGFSGLVAVAVLLWLFVLPVLGIRCWMGGH